MKGANDAGEARVRAPKGSHGNNGADLTAGPLLARNAVLNLVGQGLPLVVALFAIPFLTRGLGPERFGLLALSWAFIGYFTVFDLGLGRSLTQMAAEKLGRGRSEEVPELAWTALILMMALGVVGTGVVLVLGPVLVNRILQIPPSLQGESLRALQLLALSLPLVIGTIGFRGFLEAHQRFDLVNLIRAPMGAFTFLAPLAVLPFSRRLDVIVGVLVAGRVLSWGIHAALCMKVVPELRHPRWVAREAMSPLLRLGGWITVSNLVSPLLFYSDRFLIGSVLSVGAVAFYATPHEVLTKVLIIPIALTSVFFPAFASAFRESPKRTGEMFDVSIRSILLLLFPVLITLFLFASEGLDAWVGAEYASQGAPVVRWLAVGLLFNGLAQVPFALVQGVGRPDLTARFHLLEAPIYLALLWWALDRYGLAGAAFAWSVRAFLDAVLLFWAARRLLPVTKGGVDAALVWGAGGAFAFGLAPVLKAGVGGPGALAMILVSFGVGAWMWLLPKDGAGGRLRPSFLMKSGVLVMALVGGSSMSLSPREVGAQERASSSGAQRIYLPDNATVNSPLEDYLRLLGVTGRTAPYPWSMRGFSLREIRLQGPGTWDHPWASRLTFDLQKEGGPAFRLLPVQAQTIFNSTFPMGENDGPLWAGKGLTGEIRFGGVAEWGPLSLRLEPSAFWAQNGEFDLPSGSLLRPGGIDAPWRFGESAYSRVDPGESYLRLDTRWISLGASTAAQHWGPARRYPLVMGKNAGGYPHVFLGTGSPVGIGIGTIHFRGIWGKLSQSDYSPAALEAPDRLGSAAVLVYSPKGVEGLELGVSRMFHIAWKEGGPAIKDFLRPFEGFLKTTLEKAELEPDTSIWKAENQVASFFGRWVFPEAGLELYMESYREDHSWDLRDLIMEPDHIDALTVGFQKAWERNNEEWWTFGGELLNARISHLKEIRGEGPPYPHGKIRQGHTSLGQFLGSPAAYGGSGGILEVRRFTPSGSWRFWWERAQRNEGRNGEGNWVVDAQQSLGVSTFHFRGSLTLAGEILGTWNLNRDLGEDAWNLRCQVGSAYVFGGM